MNIEHIKTHIFKEPVFKNHKLTSKGVLLFSLGLFDVVKYCLSIHDYSFSTMLELKKYWFILGMYPNYINLRYYQDERKLLNNGYFGKIPVKGTRFMKNIQIGWPDIISTREADIIKKFKPRYPEKEFTLIALPDFVDHKIFKPLALPKIYDLVYTGRFVTFKRHDVLLNNLIKLKKKGISLKVLILNYESPTNNIAYENKIRDLIVNNKLDVEILNNLPAGEVCKCINRSKIGVMLSLKEGGCAAITEYLMADIPVLAMKSMRGGGILYFNKQCGILTGNNDLADNLISLVHNHAKYHPRNFILDKVDKNKTNLKLKDSVRKLCHKRGIPADGRFNIISYYDYYGYEYDINYLINNKGILESDLSVRI